jgi:2-polyprenyl-3-methyl-5-hydroxy-6-metoxy-1,4-benzoquinol methylase
VDPKYGERYRELFEKHWWWRARTELVVDTLRRLQPAQGWKTILDIGCGDGLFFDRLSKFGEVEGVEPFAELVSPDNPHRSRISICRFDENFQPGKQYSLVLMLDVLEHLENPVVALRHVLELLTLDGILVATVPAFMRLWTNHDVLNHHFTRYTKSSFREVAHQAGLRIWEEHYLYHWTCPVKLGLGVMERIFHLEPEPPRVPAGWANEALYWVSRAEQKTLSVLPMPFGSSLMVVANKGENPCQNEPVEIVPLTRRLAHKW